MDEPSEQEEPEHPGEAELDDRHQQAALDELAQARDEKTTYGGDDVSCRTLTAHNW